MGRLHHPDPVQLVVAAFSRHDDALQWARDRLEREFGPVEWTSPRYPFVQTEYYAATMGSGLWKYLLVFANWIEAERLRECKLVTNQLEAELAELGRFAEPRPVNLDPGILSLGKFQLASTKDQAHRVYVGRGIFVETTLRYEAGAFEPWPWTYADYRTEHVRAFLATARERYRHRLRNQR
jgi:hypothetical protein